MRYISLILTIILTLVLFNLSYSQSLKCSHCGKPIEGQYIEFDGGAYHPQCYDKISLKCHYCGEVIEGYYLKDTRGNAYHQDCFKKNVADKCSVCGKPIIGQYRIDIWGNEYHLEHEKDFPRCEYCKRLVSPRLTGGGKKFEDGRVICNICLNEGVYNGHHANVVVIEIQNFLALKGINIDMTNVPVHLVKRQKLTELAGGFDSKDLGFTKFDKISIAGYDLRIKNVIYIQEGLPERLFRGVLAHEMMHVWLNENCEQQHSERLAEGSANYLAYLVYSSRDDTWSKFLLQNLMEDNDTVYGEGFKLAKNFVDNNGFGSLLQYLSKHTDF